MSDKEYLSLTEDQKIEAVQHHLNYLEKEGMVVKMKNGNYRLKTEKEIKQELEDIINS
jgi:DNA-binding transcriptional ArsR family regulator